MIRVLVMIAVSGFVLCLATLTAATIIGGPEALSRAAWSWGANRNWAFHERHWEGSNHWSWDRDHDHGDRWADDSGAQTTRELAWTGGDTLEIDVPAEVRYTQATGPAKLTISGSKRAVEDVEIENGHIRFDHGRRHSSRLSIVMTAPNINRFDLHGSSSLEIADYRQDRLRIDLSGNADVTAAGEVGVAELDISGSAEADLGKLKAKGAEVDITGSGEATIAPTDWAKVDISGSGDVTLLTNPPKLDSDISGSGSLHRGDEGASPSPSPSESPSPSPSPPRSGKKL
jgi:hypothetical protein